MEQNLHFYSNVWFAAVATAVCAYLLGSVNFSIIITRKVADNADIRAMGSGNAGFTNVLRTVGKTPAVVTMVLDFIKCIIAVVIGIVLFGNVQNGTATHTELISYGKYIAGVFCIIGHMFPCYFGFKGGKGVVASCAMILMVDYRVWIILCSLFLIIFFTKKIVSLGSIIGIACFPIATFCFGYFADYKAAGQVSMTYVIASTLLALLVSVIVIVRHKGNIQRLLNGTEKRITPKK